MTDIPESPGVYRWVNLYTLDMYVGSAADLRRRWKQHRRDMKLGQHPNRGITNLVQLHGADSFGFEVLELCAADRLHEREAAWIVKLDPSLNRCSPPGTDCLVDRDLFSLNVLVPTELHKLLRIEAINRGATVQELVAQALRMMLDKVEHPPKAKGK